MTVFLKSPVPLPIWPVVRMCRRCILPKQSITGILIEKIGPDDHAFKQALRDTNIL